ncbi:guanylate cyclase soluble subunit beta-2-like [Mercenaria mercenaria]|uniref:guanylate cyclase soluble subunit beta-2-like n=1 Tax=Mercenaria mercenaria TaxID=6596 RepID=UPI00234F4784|nr:guanylate cyclase soluble subunit beta-2-like [Mercenaria mercenaria]
MILKHFQLLTERQNTKESVYFSLKVGDVVHTLQNERDVMSLYVSVHDDPAIERLLIEAYKLTDDALLRLPSWVTVNFPSKFRSKESFITSLTEMRNQTESLTYKEVTRQFADDIGVFIDWMMNAVKEERDSDIWAELVAFHMLINGKECIGVQLSLGAYFFTHGGLDLKALLWYKANHDLGETFLGMFESYSAVAFKSRLDHIDIELESRMQVMQQKIIENTTEVYSTEEGMIWVENMTSYINQLNDVVRALADYITMRTNEEIFNHRLNVTVDVTVLVITMVVACLVSFVIYKISKSIDRVKKCLQEKTMHLEKEQKRTESLLSQLVPAKIAKRMQESIVEPEYFQSVTVMFADISNFNTFMSRSTPNELLELVNDVFDVFEKQLEKRNVSKLGSTGNILMVACGLHQKHTKRHTEDIANLALDLLDRVQQIQVKQAFGEKVKLKIGISTGAVIAGVIEGKLPRYCLFGETVVEAQLLLDTCLPLRIHISETTYSQLSSKKMYLIKERDDIPKKNGSVQKKTYWLCGNLNSTVLQIDLDVNNSLV